MTFKGFCVGGPKAGQIIASERDTLTLAVYPRLSIMDFYPLDEPSPISPIKTVTYFYVPMGLRDNDKHERVGFFTVDRRWTMHETLVELMDGYEERARIERKREDDPGLDHYVKRALGEFAK